MATWQEGGGLKVCDVIFEEGPEQHDGMWWNVKKRGSATRQFNYKLTQLPKMFGLECLYFLMCVGISLQSWTNDTTSSKHRWPDDHIGLLCCKLVALMVLPHQHVRRPVNVWLT